MIFLFNFAIQFLIKKMKKFALLLFGFLFSLSFAQIPPNYYLGTEGVTGYALKTKLNVIISNGALDLGYGSGTGIMDYLFYV